MRLRPQGAIVEWFPAEGHGDTRVCAFSFQTVRTKEPVSLINRNKTKEEGLMCDIHGYGLMVMAHGVVSMAQCDLVTFLMFRRLGWQAATHLNLNVLELRIQRGFRDALLWLTLHIDPAGSETSGGV